MSPSGPPFSAQLVLVRHGESEANAANRFAGHADSPLTATGRVQAREVAAQLRMTALRPARVFSSPLTRCTETASLIIDELGLLCTTRAEIGLTERDYGALAGMNKDEAVRLYGAGQVHAWRRSYATPPPNGESLRDAAARVLACYIKTVLPAAMEGGTTLVVAHGNSLRGLIMALDALDATSIEMLELPNGAVHLYELSHTTAVSRHAELHSAVMYA